MLRQLARLHLARLKPTHIVRNVSDIKQNEYFEDSLLPKVSKEGIPMRDPRDINDPDYENPVGNIETENFTFDAQKGIGLTKESERGHFEEYVSKFGDARFSDFLPQIQNRDFKASKEEWKFVERLLPLKLKPQIPHSSEPFPSGFRLPTISPDEAINKFGYFVARTTNHMLPVYSKVEIHQEDEECLITTIKMVEGDLFRLKRDLDSFLKHRFECDFISRVSELQSHIVYKGDLEAEFKEFILNKGF